MTRLRTELNWRTVDERLWSPHLPPNLRDGRFRVSRIRPDDREYDQVVDLRYNGLIETGFLDPRKDTPDAMVLERDIDSVIIGVFRDDLLYATLTLNTVTDRFPGLAMELEKKVRIEHPYFRHPGALEFTKLIGTAAARRSPVSLQLLYVAVLTARALGKPHFWQVSRDVESDILWREKFGFEYSLNYCFADPSLNDMPSCVGYACLDTVLSNPRVHWLVRRTYRSAMRVELDVEQRE